MGRREDLLKLKFQHKLVIDLEYELVLEYGAVLHFERKLKWEILAETLKGRVIFYKEINYQGNCSMKERRRVKAAVNCCGLTCIKANVTMQI